MKHFKLTTFFLGIKTKSETECTWSKSELGDTARERPFLSGVNQARRLQASAMP